jgi:dTDP-4-amino-4,6-dideoxygalactose transaminase
MEEIVRCAQHHDLLVIEDAAHAVGSQYYGRMIGTIGDVTVFSFYPTKNMTTGEGGMITTDNDELAEKMRLLAMHGISKDAWKRYTSEGSWYYEVVYAGYKYNMTDIQAALGIHQLARLEQFLATRSKYVAMYNQAFGEMPEIQIPIVNANVRHAWHLYVIQLDLEQLTLNRAQFIEALHAQNIGTSVHFIPVHLHPYYRETWGYKRGDLPKAERIYDRIVSLPLFPKMTERDVEDVIAAVRKIISQHRR